MNEIKFEVGDIVLMKASIGEEHFLITDKSVIINDILYYWTYRLEDNFGCYRQLEDSPTGSVTYRKVA